MNEVLLIFIHYHLYGLVYFLIYVKLSKEILPSTVTLSVPSLLPHSFNSVFIPFIIGVIPMDNLCTNNYLIGLLSNLDFTMYQLKNTLLFIL